MNEVIEFAASDLPELEDEGREILRRREGEIVGSTLDGQHWFAALLLQARDIMRRRRVIAERHRSRT